MDYAKSRGVPVMMPVTEADLQKPVFKKYWKEGVTRPPVREGQEINRIDLSKFANLADMFRRRDNPDFEPVAAAQAPEEEEPVVHAERPDAYRRDPFSGSEFVFGLSDCNFRPFVDRKDMSLVMFYDDPNNEKTLWAKSQLNKAARATQRENHGYGAVNCSLQRDLCQAEGVCITPMYKIYSRGRTISTVREVCTFRSEEMRGFVETFPVRPQP